MKNLLWLVLIFTTSAFSQTYEEVAEAQCSQMPLQLIGTMTDRFPKLKKELDGQYNVFLRLMGLKDLADAQMGTIVSEEFQNLFISLGKTVEGGKLTKEQFLDAHNKLIASFTKARPTYMKECKTVLIKGLKDCKISPASKELNAAQNTCMGGLMEKLTPVFTKNMPDIAADHMGAMASDKAFDEALSSNKPLKEVSEAFDKRFKFISHGDAILPRALAECVILNNKVFKNNILGLLSDPKLLKRAQDGFKNKNSILEKALKNPDLEYFKGLIELGWLNPKEKIAFAKTVKNPAALKLLK